MTFCYVISALFLLLQAFIVLTTKINIFPELVLYPWLISKGSMIYRDFNVQHGYVLQLLLLPFTSDKSLFFMKGLYVMVQMVDLFLVLKILKKTTNKLGFILGGGLFIVLNYYLSDSNLWDEVIVTSVYLFIYYLLIRDSSRDTRKILFIGLLIGFVSFMKPSFVIMILPIILFYKSFTPAISIVALWAVTFVYFAITNNVNGFMNSYIYYNIFYALGSRDTFEPLRMFSLQGMSTDKLFTNSTYFLLVLSILLLIIYRKKYKSNPIILFVLFSFALVFPGYGKINLVPFGAFFSVLVGQLIGSIKKQYLLLYLFCLALYGVFMSRQAKHLYTYFKTNRLPYMENEKTAKIISKIKNYNLTGKKVYVLSNQVEIYYYLDKIPPVYHTVLWGNIIYYYPDIQQRTISEIERNKVTFIIIPKPLDTNYSTFDNLIKYIDMSYKLIYENDDFKMLKKNN